MLNSWHYRYAKWYDSSIDHMLSISACEYWRKVIGVVALALLVAVISSFLLVFGLGGLFILITDGPVSLFFHGEIFNTIFAILALALVLLTTWAVESYRSWTRSRPGRLRGQGIVPGPVKTWWSAVKHKVCPVIHLRDPQPASDEFWNRDAQLTNNDD